MFDEYKKNQDKEERESLAGFFNLLLQIDKRNNPHLYKNQYDRHGHTNNTETSGDSIATEGQG